MKDDGHVEHHNHSDHYWDWTIDDMGMFDFPALVEYVSKQSTDGRIHYIGHSQGNAQAFMALSGHPRRRHLRRTIKSFTALAPAAIMGDLVK